MWSFFFLACSTNYYCRTSAISRSIIARGRSIFHIVTRFARERRVWAVVMNESWLHKKKVSGVTCNNTQRPKDFYKATKAYYCIYSNNLRFMKLDFSLVELK